MATEHRIAMVVDEFGAPERNMDPNLFGDEQTGVAKKKDTEKVDLWMTAPLQQAARELQKSWENSLDDRTAELGVRDVDLKFASHKEQMDFLMALEDLAKQVNPNYPSTFPLLKPAAPELSDKNTADGFWLKFWWKYFLTDAFDTIMQDAAVTKLNSIPVQAETVTQAQAYVRAYGIGFVRMELVAEEGMDISMVDSLTESLREIQSRLVEFLKILVAEMPSANTHQVVIGNADEFEVDGKPTKFKGAQLRALLALALLREKREFKMQDFAKNYHGGNTVDARHDFDNGFNALRKMLPKISRQASEHNRTVNGIKFQVLVADTEITERLRSLHKKPSS